jgi:hypothetical protein
MYSYAKRVKLKYLKHPYRDVSQVTTKGTLVRSPLEQFLLKIKAVKSDPGNWNLTGKIPA